LFGAAYRHISTGVIALTDPATPILPVANPSNLFPGPLAVVSARLTTTENAFAMEAGGGLDYKISKYFSVRPVEVAYVLTRFPGLSTGFRETRAASKPRQASSSRSERCKSLVLNESGLHRSPWRPDSSDESRYSFVESGCSIVDPRCPRDPVSKPIGFFV
jgi:hypothetical protein